MTSINTQVGFLAPPNDHMSERGPLSPREKANQIQDSPQLSQNSSLGNDYFALFTPTTKHLQGPLDPKARPKNPFFQSANRANVNSLREPANPCASVLQEAGRETNGVHFENDQLESSQNHLASSHVFSSFESLHKASLLEKQRRKDTCNYLKTSGITESSSASAQIARRVPVFKTARNKTSNVPVLGENKAVKRLIASSEEEQIKKHAGIFSFNHSAMSPFKPVATNGTSDKTTVPFPPLSARDSDHQKIPSTNKSKTVPRKPKFGKSHPSLSKNIKEERDPSVTEPENGKGNREVSDALLSCQPGEENGSIDQTQEEINFRSPSLKEKSSVDESKHDTTGTSGTEFESEVEESLLTLTPIQCKLTNKMIKTPGKKKLPPVLGSKKNKAQETKINKKKHLDSRQHKKKEQFQGKAPGKNSPSEVSKDINKGPSHAIQQKQMTEPQTTQASKKSYTQMKKKKLNDGWKSSLSNGVKIKRKGKSLKNWASTYVAKQQCEKVDLQGQMESDTDSFYPDGPSHKPSVSEDLTDSALRSSPLSHDTTASSLDSAYSRTSELSPCLGKARNLERNRYEEEASRVTDEEVTKESKAAKESVLQLLDSVDRDIWVQCDRCSKWRKLSPTLDPATLPNKWYCTMLPVPGKNSCQEPEEDWNRKESYIYYEHQFVLGSVVWAQVPGSPWWPGMVDIDPDYKRYDWFNTAGTSATSYHVTFFGNPVMRAWVTCSNIRVFKEHDSYKKFIHDKKDPTQDNLLRKAVQEATYALSMEVQRRRRTYTFVSRYTGRIGKKSPPNNCSETSEGKRVPLKTRGHRKQRKDFKGFCTAAPQTAPKFISSEPADTVGVNDDIRNRSQSPQETEISNQTDRGRYESRLEQQELDTNESFQELNSNKSNSDNDEYLMDKEEKEEDCRVSAGSVCSLNANNTMEYCNRECSHDEQHANIDEYQETGEETSSDSNADSTLKNNRNFQSKMTKEKNIVESYTGIEETIEKMNIINNGNVAANKQFNSNEVYETDYQENETLYNMLGTEGTFDNVHENDLEDNEGNGDRVDGSDLQDNEYTDSYYEEQNASEIDYKEKYQSDDQDNTGSCQEYNDTESDSEKYSFEGDNSEYIEQGDQVGNEDEDDEQDDREGNNEQDVGAYEGQDNGDNVESNECTFRQTSEYDDENNEDNFEAPSNYEHDDSEKDNESSYEGQDIDNNGAIENFDYSNNENYNEDQNECSYEERDIHDHGESEYNYEERQTNNNKEHIFGDYDECYNENECAEFTGDKDYKTDDHKMFHCEEHNNPSEYSNTKEEYEPHDSDSDN